MELCARSIGLLTAHNHSQTHRTRHNKIISVCSEKTHLANYLVTDRRWDKSNTVVQSRNSNGHRNGGPQQTDNGWREKIVQARKYPQNMILCQVTRAINTVYFIIIIFINNNRFYPVGTYLPRVFTLASAKQDRIVSTNTQKFRRDSKIFYH